MFVAISNISFPIFVLKKYKSHYFLYYFILNLYFFTILVKISKIYPKFYPSISYFFCHFFYLAKLLYVLSLYLFIILCK